MTAQRHDVMARPSQFWPLPSADALRDRYVGAPLSSLPTPAVILDRARIASNSAAMLNAVENHWQCRFRAHIKTHKTREGTLAQVGRSRDHAIIVSTLAEAWGVVDSGLVQDGTVRDILYGVPLGIDKVAAFLSLCRAAKDANNDCDVRALVDHPDQVAALQDALKQDAIVEPVRVFVKIDCGYKRAGVTPGSEILETLVKSVLTTSHLYIHGVYCHAGFSYDSKTIAHAQSCFSTELQSANEGARRVATYAQANSDLTTQVRSPLVMSVGSTPTAHAAASLLRPEEIGRIKEGLYGELELHAGNYPFLDLQQLATSAIPKLAKPSIEHCAMTVLTSVLSVYPGRGSATDATDHIQAGAEQNAMHDEALCDAGSLAMSKDVGSWPGYGHVVAPADYTGWHLSRISQEHGVLGVYKAGELERLGVGSDTRPRRLTPGTRLRVIPQHACMVAAAHAWFFIVDSSLNEDEPMVHDVWVPWKGW